MDSLILLEGAVTSTGSSDIFPGRRANERKFVRGDAHNFGVVVVVELFDPKVVLPLQNSTGIWYLAYRCKSRAGKLGERVEKDIVSGKK